MITFTKEQLATLRKIAQQATQDEWRAFISPGTDTYAVHTPEDERCGDIINWPGFDGRKNAKNNAEFIAVFNPKVVLALLDVLEASREAEPVAWKAVFTQVDQESNTFTAMYSDKAEVERWVRLHEVGDFRADITPLYAAPVVPEEISMSSSLPLMSDQLMALGYVKGWNACRAAMLKGGA